MVSGSHVEELAPGVNMKQHCGLVGAGILSLALITGCGAADDGALFSPSETLAEHAMSANAGSPAEMPALVPAPAPPSASPNRDSTSGRDGMPIATAIPPGSSSPPPAPAPPVPSSETPTPPAPDAPSPPAPEAPNPPGPDAPPAEPAPPSCVLGEFGPLQKLSGLGLDGPLWGPVLAAADTALFFVFANSSGAEQIFLASRPNSSSTQFSAANPVRELASNASDGTPFVSASGLRIYFYSSRAGSNAGSRDLWVAERPTPTEAFRAPTPLLELNSASGEFLPRLSADELSIVFISQRPEGRGATDIWQARRSSASAPFGAPTNLAELNTNVEETGAWLSSDGLTIYFSSNRPGGTGRLDIWRATRSSVDQPFGPAEDMPGINTASDELDFALSSNERELLLSSDRDGAPELWRSVRACR
jgi:hypothetical protein